MRIGKVPSLISKIQAFNGSDWVNLLTESTDYNALRVAISQLGNVASVINQAVDSRVTSTLGLAVGSFLYGYNNSSWDRIRTHYKSTQFNFTAPGTTSIINFVTGMSKFTWQVLTDASATPVTIKLEGSIDGTNFFTLDEYTGTENTMRHVVNKAVIWVRFNVVDLGDATYVKLRIFAMR